jgi:hypothetical protein
MPYIYWVWENGGQTHKLHNNINKSNVIKAMYYFPSAMESSICAKIIIVIIVIIIIIIIVIKCWKTEWAFFMQVYFLFCGISVEKCTSSSQGIGHYSMWEPRGQKGTGSNLPMYQPGPLVSVCVHVLFACH